MAIEDHKAVGVIPARAKSTRFPNKVIAPILGKPMMQYIWEAAQNSKKLDRVIIATDDERVAAIGRGFGAEVVITPADLPTGSDRVALVAHDIKSRWVINLQADEPLLSAESIDRLVQSLMDNPSFEIATFVVRKNDSEGLHNPNTVKAVGIVGGPAFYFSRQPLLSSISGEYLKHVGIYGYRSETLQRFCQLPPSELEKAERLEQLRAMENNMPILLVELESDTIGVDVESDVARVEKILRSKERLS